jgi:hypothetical protein
MNDSFLSELGDITALGEGGVDPMLEPIGVPVEEPQTYAAGCHCVRSAPSGFRARVG